jgi:hypothetical protein
VGKKVFQKCGLRACVNPEHLFTEEDRIDKSLPDHAIEFRARAAARGRSKRKERADARREAEAEEYRQYRQDMDALLDEPESTIPLNSTRVNSTRARIARMRIMSGRIVHVGQSH